MCPIPPSQNRKKRKKMSNQILFLLHFTVLWKSHKMQNVWVKAIPYNFHHIGEEKEGEETNLILHIKKDIVV
jgi:hypothetical protein